MESFLKIYNSLKLPTSALIESIKIYSRLSIEIRASSMGTFDVANCKLIFSKQLHLK